MQTVEWLDTSMKLSELITHHLLIENFTHLLE